MGYNNEKKAMEEKMKSFPFVTKFGGEFVIAWSATAQGFVRVVNGKGEKKTTQIHLLDMGIIKTLASFEGFAGPLGITKTGFVCLTTGNLVEGKEADQVKAWMKANNRSLETGREVVSLPEYYLAKRVRVGQSTKTRSNAAMDALVSVKEEDLNPRFFRVKSNF
jgi:hypothetical protein